MSDEELETLGDREPHGRDAWQRFADNEPPHGVASVGFVMWDVLAAGLALAAVLMFLAALFLLAAKGGGPERVFAASQSAAEPLIAAFALAAVGVEAALGAYWRRALARWAVRGGVGIAIATVVAALYAVGYLAVVHPSLVGIGVGQATLRAFAATDDWSSRVEGILTAAAAAALATTAVYVAHRSDRRSPDSPTTRP